MNLFDKCILLIALSLIFLLFGVLGYNYSNNFKIKDIPPLVSDNIAISFETAQSEEPKEPEELEESEEQQYNFAHSEMIEIKRKMGEIELTCARLIIGNEYRMFLTAYCAEECGWSYETSSGATCHRAYEANRYSEPTTCAIDRRYFSYGTMFYVPSEDRVYIAEDTGPGVRGMWIDTYQNDMEDVVYYNTRYETIYTVEIEYYTVQASNYDVRYYIYNDLLGDTIND